VRFFPNIWSKEKENTSLNQVLKNILGYTPKNKTLYQKAFTHRSVNRKNKDGVYINFERLEFLGDTVIDTVVAHFLYSELNQDNEGELTKMKSKIVSREKLNYIGKELNLLDYLFCTGNKENFGDDIHGNILEALIGAIFMDKGYEACKNTLINVFFKPYIDLDSIENTVVSYKSLLIEWSQKNKKNLVFETDSDNGKDPNINFYCKILLDNKVKAKSRDVSKKKAEEKAAKRAYKVMKIKDQI